MLFNFKLVSYFKVALKIFLSLTALMLIVFSFLNIPTLLPIKQIIFEGNVKHINESEIIKILDDNNFNGMLSVDLQSVRQKILNNNWLKAVQVRKVWPDTLMFSFQEYQPIAKINQQYLLESGKLTVAKQLVLETPLIEITFDESQVNKKTDYLSLLSILKNMQLKLKRQQLEFFEFEIGKNNNWLIQIKNRFSIKLGRKQQQQRIDNFILIYAAIENKKQIESIDLRYSNGLAVKLMESILTNKGFNKKALNEKQNG